MFGDPKMTDVELKPNASGRSNNAAKHPRTLRPSRNILVASGAFPTSATKSSRNLRCVSDTLLWPPLIAFANCPNRGALSTSLSTSGPAPEPALRYAFSAVGAFMFDDGRMIARLVDDAGRFQPLASVDVVGDDLSYWPSAAETATVPEFGRRVTQTFGAGTYDRLRRLRIGIVGCSGTGSPLIEQLARNCVGTMVLVDPDRVEEKNLNRILNATIHDARHARLKVDVAARAIRAMGLGTVVDTHPRSLFDPDTVRAVAGCDVVFGCMDSIDGRHLLNKLATFYLLPYFDLGVKLEADGRGGVDQVCGTVHYLQPGVRVCSAGTSTPWTRFAPRAFTARTRAPIALSSTTATSAACRRTGRPSSS